MHRIVIDAGGALKPFPSRWRQCIGSGNMSLALRKEYQDALAAVQREIGFSYIRGHGLLSDAVGVYRDRFYNPPEDYGGPGPGFNFTYVDLIYDSFLEKGLRPFVELGFMPRELASGKKTCFWWQGNVTPPEDYAEWRRMIKALVTHLLRRYGREEILQWPFEVWNEPDAPAFWSEDRAEYFRLYRETARAVKEVDADLSVGGPATCPAGISWITPFLEMCDAHDIPVDFVSTHSYCAHQTDYVGEYVYQTMHPVTHSLDQFRDARDRIRTSPFPELPLHITEYNSSYSARSPIHDTALNAAFLGRLLSEGSEYADSFSYWTFSDVFEENDIPRAVFHGGFGLMALHGIRKPAYHLFAFFRRLGDELLHRDERMIVTRRKDGTIALIAWNPVLERGTNERTQLALDLPAPGADVVVHRQRVNEEAGNAWACWRTLGRPRYPSKDQVEMLRRAAVPSLETRRLDANEGRVTLDLSLTKNEVSLLEILARNDESASYAGLDDTRIPGY